jgi:hypothetical protein
MDRTITSYRVHGQDIDVIEQIDDGGDARITLVADGVPLPIDLVPSDVPDRHAVADVVARWWSHGLRDDLRHRLHHGMHDAIHGELDDDELAGLYDALNALRRAHATNSCVVDDHGQVHPFVNVVMAQAHQIDEIIRILERHGAAIPDDPWPGRVHHAPTVLEACEDGLAAETGLSALFDRLLAASTRPDIIGLYRHLHDAVRLRHLPAFRRCVVRLGDGTGGRGPGG